MMRSKARPCCASATDTALWCGSRAPAFGVHAEVVLQKRQQGCRTPNLPVYGLQVSFESDVGAEGLRANSLQRRKFKIGRDGEGHSCFAGDFRRVKEKKFVDDSCAESVAV